MLNRTRTVWTLCAGAVLIAVATTCTPKPRGDVGLVVRSEGPAVLLRLCADDSLREIRLYRDPGSMPSDEDLLWTAQPETGDPADEVLLGVPSTGMQVEPTSSVDMGVPLVLVINSVREEFTIGFSRETIRSDTVLAESTDALMSLDQFDAQARGDC